MKKVGKRSAFESRGNGAEGAGAYTSY